MRAGVECTGSYEAALTRHLRREGVQVVEVNQPDKATRRRRGKTDAVDAEAAARAVLSERATAVPKAGDGHVEAMRVFKLAKDSAVKSRTQAINQLKAVLVNADPALRESLAGLSTKTLIRRCAELPDHDSGGSTPAATAALYTLRLPARRIQQLTAEARDLDLHSQASFAALCGVSPVEASSGKTQRRRLNRGGDRQANAALYRIVLSRLRWDQRTRDYLERRLSEGKTRREAIRCIKRYVAREIYNLIRPRASSQHIPASQPKAA